MFQGGVRLHKETETDRHTCLLPLHCQPCLLPWPPPCCEQYAEEVMEKGGREARKELNLLTALLAVQSKAQVRGCVVSFGAAWVGLASHAGS